MRRIVVVQLLVVFLMACLTLNSYAEQLKETFTNTIGMEFSLIRPGGFTMGSPEDEPGRYTGERLHHVNLTDHFYMQKTEVTQEQWAAVMKSNPSSSKGCGGNCPVEQVSWNDVQEFIQRLNLKEDTGSYRLPTEAEWEYACRAGNASAFHDGGITHLQCGDEPNMDKAGWYCGNSKDRIHPVAQKKPNAWGLYDMHGNVQEWCQDWFSPYPFDEVNNPKGPPSGSYRVMRGGAWYSPARDCRSASRFGSPPHYRFRHIGFRLCKTP